MGCYIIFTLINKELYSGYMLLNDLKTGIFLIGTLLFLTPVLKSLFVAYSDDTIVYIVCILELVHLFSYDYLMAKKPITLDSLTQNIGSPLSLNAIFFAAILISSRL